MINSKRILKLRTEISKKVGQTKYIKFSIKAKEGLFLVNFNTPGNIHQSKYTRIKNLIEGLEIYDFSEWSIEDILIIGDGKSEPTTILDDVL
ncbi:MAG: hypothetical protein GX309_04195 [Clostridiales bacterium]|nr:hypothetical protein [Clostridiales bacterium]